MGKRSDMVKRDKDQYLTPQAAVVPLVPFLPESFTFAEPCAGDGRLVKHIESLTGGRLSFASDMYPDDELLQPHQISGIMQRDALTLSTADTVSSDFIITNPPWSRDKKSGYLLHNLIETFARLKPTWLLFDADWAHTKQATPYLKKYGSRIVSVGRVKWIEDSNMSGKDNCAWYLFDKNARHYSSDPIFSCR